MNLLINQASLQNYSTEVIDSHFKISFYNFLNSDSKVVYFNLCCHYLNIFNCYSKYQNIYFIK